MISLVDPLILPAILLLPEVQRGRVLATQSTRSLSTREVNQLYIHDHL
jgi:hypothetical protein